ncbi:MAG TPA: ATP-binding protein [Saprospiraceae bacterium]|nr:ATP-binding protein [Saprospiraceae bacterium]HMQ82889.1 ATP-binding protein [Saprospiraceae bacterium]
MVKRLLPALICLSSLIASLPLKVSSQSSPIIDSLKTLLHSDTLGNPGRADILNAISQQFRQVELKEALAFSEQALALAREHHLPLLPKYYKDHAYIMLDAGLEMDKIISVADSGLFFAKTIRDSSLITGLYQLKGICAERSGEMDEALSYYYTGLTIARQSKNKRHAASFLNQIASIQGDRKEINKALESYEEAYQLAKADGWELMQSIVANNIAQLYAYQGKHQEALNKYLESIALKRKLGRNTNLIISLCALGEFYAKMGSFTQAKVYLQEGIALAQSIDYAYGLETCYCNQMHTAMEEKNWSAALEAGKLGLAILDTTGRYEKQFEFYEGLAQIYENMGDYQAAYQAHRQFKIIGDSLLRRHNIEAVQKLEQSAALVKSRLDNELLQKQRESDRAKLKQRNIVILLNFIIVMLLGLFIFSLVSSLRQRKRINEQLSVEVKKRTESLEKSVEQLRKANEMLERFAYIVSHDLKEPIRNINSFVGLIKRYWATEWDSNAQEYLQYITQNANQMNDLIEDILSFSVIKDTHLKPESVDIRALVEEAKNHLAPLLQNGKAKILLLNDEQLVCSRPHLQWVLNNLIENGLKFNASALPIITISVEHHDHYQLICVEDNGIGIEAQYYEQIFVMFKRLHSREAYPGSGIGLAVCKWLVEEALGGRIRVKSTPGKGSIFMMYLPHNPALLSDSYPVDKLLAIAE